MQGHLARSGMWLPPIRAYMDDVTVTRASVPGSRWILQRLKRSRSLVLKRSRVSDKFHFAV